MVNISKKFLLLVILLVSVFAFTSCKKAYDSLIGKWEYSTSGASMSFTFNEDRTGTFELKSGSDSEVKEYTYTYDENEITYTFKEYPNEVHKTTYAFKDGKLVLSDKGGTYTFSKK